MKTFIRSVLLILFLIILLPLNTVFAATPDPQVFYGIVTLDGSLAPDGTIIKATLNGKDNISFTFNNGYYYVTIEPQENDRAGDTIYFYINDFTAATDIFTPGAQTLLSLSATSQMYTLTISTSGNGSVSGAGSYQSGTMAIISATAEYGWLFQGWTSDTGTILNTSSANTSITMNGDYSITANFVKAEMHDLTVMINGNGSTQPSEGIHSYVENEKVDLIAIPADGWKFDSWTGDVADPDSANTTVTMDSNKTITANFIAGEPEKYTLAINVSGEGSTDPAAGVYSYAPGAVVDISAIPVDGWVFDSWTGYVANPDSADTTIIMNADKNITAVFSDVTPPEVSTVSSSDVGKTEANISWSTDEPGSSQVEYWASSSQFTKADLRMVTDHFVHLTGLTPATKYSCRVISVDENGNETISGTYTFTTSGSPAAFTTDDWDMQLSDVEGGKKAIVSFTITNAGDTSGRYSEILKVNGEAEDIKNGILAGGDSEEIKFTVIKTVIGTYEISVDEFSSSFTVPVSGLPIWIKVTGIILGTLILNALISFLIIYRV